jgi:hypothetical protein
MSKGQIIGPKTPRRGMLPPSGHGPIEVTKDGETSPVPSQQQTSEDTAQPVEEAEAAPAPAAEPDRLLPDVVGKALVAELPDISHSPAEIVVACEKRLHAANALLDAMQQKALSSYFQYAGPAVRLAWSTESWREAVDPSTGKPCRSWSAWLKLVKVSRQHAYRMTREEPLRDALAGLSVESLGVRQIDALSPVLTGHGPEKVRTVWEAALDLNDTSAPSLLRLRKQFGLDSVKEVSEGESNESKSDVPVLRFQSRPGAFDPDLVRRVARSQPEVSLLVARTIFKELGVDSLEE